jgi:N-acetylglucosamine kinase-like BadF-type ATPase
MHVLGIDAGGTKTTCLLADATGEVMGRGDGGGANLQAHGELEVEKVLHQVIERAIGDRGLLPNAVCLGIAGVDRREDRQVMRDIMRRLGFRERTLVVNDALVALVAGVGDDPGLVVVAGTGSIAFGVNGARQAARAGGWGAVLGDEGSGFWIGRHALTAVMREADGRGPRTQLTPLVLERFARTGVEQLVYEVHDRTGRQAVASLGPIVARARDAGDVVAAEILRAAADELTRAAATVVARLQMRGDAFRIVLSGSMFRIIPWLAEEMPRRLVEVAPRAIAAPLDGDAARGAVHLALQEARGVVRLPVYTAAEGTPRDM